MTNDDEPTLEQKNKMYEGFERGAGVITQLVPTKSDAEYSRELKERLYTAIEPVLKVIDEAKTSEITTVFLRWLFKESDGFKKLFKPFWALLISKLRKFSSRNKYLFQFKITF